MGWGVRVGARTDFSKNKQLIKNEKIVHIVKYL